MKDATGKSVRWMIVTLGRSGSSLLATIMADAGAQFGITAPAEWDPRAGEMEDPDAKRAAHQMRRAFDIDSGRRHVLFPQIEARLRRGLARKYLKQSLLRAECVKIGDLDLLVQSAFALGYSPRVILNYRRFQDCLVSNVVGRKHSGPDSIAEDYRRIYRQGFELLKIFGGCAISYEEMLANPGGSWLAALGTVAGLDRSSLQAAATRRIRRSESGALESNASYPECDAIYDRIAAEAGRIFEPTRHVRRARGVG
ncbi:MAG: hypothetical protein QE509_01255 [Gammaproteobacteria bacterium]|nr:hypothetical protein [Gammaproteobacteria bacterium]